MKVDYYLVPGSITTVTDQSRRAAALGYDGVFSPETSHDPFLSVLASAVGAPQTDLGTAIAVAFARSPMTTAYSAWDLAAHTEGRFLLGLGTQIKAHVTRRFSMPWGKPGPQMREYIAALRAIWEAWQNGTRLRFRGDYYQFGLMTPFFDPGPIDHPDIPVYIAGVGEYMSRLAGEVCQGFHVHPFHTIRYLDEVVLPAMADGAQSAGRSLAEVERAASILAVTGRTEQEMARTRALVKQQISFYASTPAYGGVLDLHGWDIGRRLTELSVRGKWAEMAELIPDDLVDEVAVVAPIDQLGSAIRDRYGDRLQRVGYYTMIPLGLDDEEWASLLADTRGG